MVDVDAALEDDLGEACFLRKLTACRTEPRLEKSLLGVGL